MKPKTYPAEKVAEVAKVLADAPTLAPKYIPHSEALAELKKHIKDLHYKKNYEAREIAKLLKEKGIKTTIKEVKILISSDAKKASAS